MFGDTKGSFFSNGLSCADMMRKAPNNCHIYVVSFAAPTSFMTNFKSTKSINSQTLRIPTSYQATTPTTNTTMILKDTREHGKNISGLCAIA